MLSLFYRYYLGICPSKLAELVPFSYPCESSCPYSDRMHDFSVIRRCYKDIYVNTLFSHWERLWNYLPAKNFPLIYDLNGFMFTVDRHFFWKIFSKVFNSFLHHFLITSYLVVVFQLFMEWIPAKNDKNFRNKRKVWFLLLLEHFSKW